MGDRSGEIETPVRSSGPKLLAPNRLHAADTSSTLPSGSFCQRTNYFLVKKLARFDHELSERIAGDLDYENSSQVSVFAFPDSMI